MFPQEFLDDLRARTSLTSLVGQTVALKKQGREMVGLCPFHAEKTPSFMVNEDKGIMHCFGCGWDGDAVDFVMQMQHVDFQEAVTRLAQNAGVNPTPPQPSSKRPPTTPEPTIIAPVPARVAAPPDHPRLGKPTERRAYLDEEGDVLGYVCRFRHADGSKEDIPQVFTDEGWRWMGFPKPRWLYGLRDLNLHPEMPVVIVEGEPCADMAAKVFTQYVAVTWPGGGKAVQHVDWRFLYGRKVLIWPDRDRHPYRDQHPLAGQEMPYEEQPGTKTAIDVAKLLEPLCAEIKIIDVRDLPNDGDDIVDRVKAGWSKDKIINWARDHVTTWGAQATPTPPEELPEFEDEVDISAPFKVAGALLARKFNPISRDWKPGAPSNGPLRHYSGLWYRWNGRCYPEVEYDLVHNVTYHWLARCAHSGMKGGVEVKPDARMVKDLIDAVAAKTFLSSSYKAPTFLDGRMLEADKCVALRNGILELRTRILHPHTPHFWSHNCVPYDYDPMAPPPVEFLNFLDSIWSADHEAINCLQEIMGYLLTPDTSLQKMFMIIGPKRSGKSTLGRVMTALIGQDNVCSPTLDSLRTDFGLQPMIGKQLALVSDARLDGQTTQITERLLSISGEDSLSVNRKNLPHWNGKLLARFVILSNLLPRFGDSSGAITSRFVVLTMKRSFYNKEDPGLTMKLLTELPAIFNWALEGWQRLNNRGYFLTPASSKDKQEELEELSAPIGSFIRDVCVIGEGFKTEVSEMFAAWCRWCRDQGRDQTGTLQTFARDLKAQEPTISTERTRGWDRTSAHFTCIGLVQAPTGHEPAKQSAPPPSIAVYKDPYAGLEPDDGW